MDAVDLKLEMFIHWIILGIIFRLYSGNIDLGFEIEFVGLGVQLKVSI